MAAGAAPNLVGTEEGASTLLGPLHGHRTGKKTVCYVINEPKDFSVTGANMTTARPNTPSLFHGGRGGQNLDQKDENTYF